MYAKIEENTAKRQTACQFIQQNAKLLVSLFRKTPNCSSVYSAKRQTACQFIPQNDKLLVSLFRKTSNCFLVYSAKHVMKEDLILHLK